MAGVSLVDSGNAMRPPQKNKGLDLQLDAPVGQQDHSITVLIRITWCTVGLVLVLWCPIRIGIHVTPIEI